MINRNLSITRKNLVIILYIAIVNSMLSQDFQDYLNAQKMLDSLTNSPQGSIQQDLYYKIYLDIYPNVAEAYMYRSVAYNKRGEHAVGFYYLNKAVDLDPIGHLGYRAFVKLYMMHDYKGALVDCLRLDSLTSYSKLSVWGEDIDMVIGLCYLQLHDLEQARLYFTNSINRISNKHGKKWNSSRVFLYLGITYIKQVKYSNAINVFNELILLNPKYSEAYYFKALAFYYQHNLKKFDSTIEESKKIFEINGAEKNPYFELPYQLYKSMINKKNPSLWDARN